MMIAIVERMQAAGSAEQDRFGAWRSALGQLRTDFVPGVPPPAAELAARVRCLPDDQREGAFLDVAASYLWQAWNAGRGPRVEDVFNANDWQAAGRNGGQTAQIPAELIEEEFLARHQLPFGDAPGPEEYAERFPHHSGLMDRLASHSSAGGRYVKLALLGLGATGEVWEARDCRGRRLVAIKQLSRDAASNPLLFRRFSTEFQTAARLTHPGIIRMLEYHDTEGAPFFTMPLLRGQTLTERIGAHHQPSPSLTKRDLDDDLRSLLKMLAKVCVAMAAAHANGVQHRDLKPANIFVREDGEPVVLDWGFAGGRGCKCGAEQEITGTPEYMAPEQAAGRPEPRSDVFGLGAILFEIVTGRPPRDAAAGLCPAQAPVPQLDQVAAEVPPGLSAICAKALAPAPANRFAGPMELATALRAWLAHHELSAWRRLFRKCR